jgi:hypothetical chaperone protein
MGLNVGLDFGTSNSGVGLYDGQRVHLLPVDPQNIMPEVVKTILYITRDDRHYIGQEAVELYYRHNVKRPRRYVKKWVGELEYIGGEMYYVRDVFVHEDELKPGRLLQYIKTALRTGDYQGTLVFERYYDLTDLITAYLRALKQRAEDYLGEPINGVTLGRPVKFSQDPARDQEAEDTLRAAAYEAGFRSVDFEFEPVAAALFYETSLDRPQNALIFDFGGGTLDLTIMRLGEATSMNRRVYANAGIGVAGSDFDRAIIQNRLLSHFGKGQAGLQPEIVELIQAVSDWSALPDWSTPKMQALLERAIREGKAPARLNALKSLVFNDLAFSFYNAVESAKIELSSLGATVIRLQDDDLELWELYTRYQFEKDIRHYRAQIEDVLLEAVAASGLEPEQIDVVVKTGGSSNIPAFTEMLGAVFSPERVKTSDVFNSVTSGLAIQAYQNG